MKLFADRDLGKKLARSLTAIGIPTTCHADRYTSPAEKVPHQRWIREATAKGEIILTRDSDIPRIDVEIRAIVESGARCFILEVGNASAIDYMRAVMAAWPRIDGDCCDRVAAVRVRHQSERPRSPPLPHVVLANPRIIEGRSLPESTLRSTPATAQTASGLPKHVR